MLDTGQVTKEGMQLCSICSLCGRTAETNTHLLMHCRVTVQLWDIFLAMIGLNWTMPMNTLDYPVRTEEGGQLSKSEDGVQSWLHLVDYLEGKELKMLRNKIIAFCF